jgi:ABC-type multidrug transport system ATPase subunit
MSLLELERLTKRYRHGSRQVDVLQDVSLELHEHELVAVWGSRRSGRSTLLRLAGGIETPDAGTVRFEGRELAHGQGAITDGIAYYQPASHRPGGEAVLQDLIGTQLALGVNPPQARTRAWEALQRVGARHCQDLRPYELDRAQAVRVSIARALLQQPRLLLIDEPTIGVDLLKRNGILELLRTLTRDGTAILMSVDHAAGLYAADRALSLDQGKLRGHINPELADVVPLPVRTTA